MTLQPRVMLPTPKRIVAAVVAVAAITFLAGCTTSSNNSSERSDHPVAASGSGSARGAPAPSALASSGLAQALQRTYGSVVQEVLPSVVEITTSEGLGSGIIFDDKGDIVTNDHVVGNATTFQVRLATGAATYKATLVGSYPPDDLAVIRVEGAKDLPVATFADSSKAKVGDIVLAMGNPLGLSSSVTEGIISATGRTVTEPSGGGSPGATIPNMIQTSAPINPGNSGGALVDLQGKVVGIPTLAAQDRQLGGPAPGIGFAIPSNTVKDIATQLVEHGKVVNSHRAALGVSVVTVTGPDGAPAGVGVVNVQSGGAAEGAGIKAGDIITAINDTKTPDAGTLSVILARLKPGDDVTVSLLRPDGSTSTVSVTLGELQAG